MTRKCRAPRIDGLYTLIPGTNMHKRRTTRQVHTQHVLCMHPDIQIITTTMTTNYGAMKTACLAVAFIQGARVSCALAPTLHNYFYNSDHLC